MGPRAGAASALSHGALTAVMGKDAPPADATVAMPRAVFETVVLGQRSMAEAIQAGAAMVSGDAACVTQMFGLFDDFDIQFPIVEPRK